MIKKVAIQGETGSFMHDAAKQWYGQDVLIEPCTSFAEVFKSLDTGDASCAVVAIENSIHGSINEVYDLLLNHKYPIIGEVNLPIKQCLITFKDVELKNIKHVHSHHVALSQCSNFLDTYLPHAKRVMSPDDTAGSVRYIKELGDTSRAAIASEGAAKLYNMPVYKKNIQNNDVNVTRFVVLDPTSQQKNTTKASLVLQTNHKPGALYNALGVFEQNNINLTKLQSRPIVGSLWRYMFYIDAEITKSQLNKVKKILANQGCNVQILGTYNPAKF